MTTAAQAAERKYTMIRDYKSYLLPILMLTSCLPLACGPADQLENSVEQDDGKILIGGDILVDPAAERDDSEEPDSEIGSLKQPLFVNAPTYGISDGSACDGSELCWFPKDKKLRIKHSFPQFYGNDTAPKADLRAAFATAVNDIQANNNTPPVLNWDIASTTGSSNEPFVVGSLGGCTYGLMEPRNLSSCTGGPSGVCEYFNGCNLTLSMANAIHPSCNPNWHSQSKATKEAWLAAVMFHEIAHCMAVRHSSSGSNPYIMNSGINDVEFPPAPLSLNSTDRANLRFYQP